MKYCECDKQENLKAKISYICKNCNKKVKKASLKNKAKITGIALISMYAGSQAIDYAITDNRYSIAAEYTILDTCSNSSRRRLSTSQYNTKKEICLCALESTMNEISFIRYKLDEDSFFEAFNKNIRSCK